MNDRKKIILQWISEWTMCFANNILLMKFLLIILDFWLCNKKVLRKLNQKEGLNNKITKAYHITLRTCTLLHNNFFSILMYTKMRKLPCSSFIHITAVIELFLAKSKVNKTSFETTCPSLLMPIKNSTRTKPEVKFPLVAY